MTRARKTIRMKKTSQTYPIYINATTVSGAEERSA